MPTQPTPLTIATSSLQRLIKEQASYHRELEMQQKAIEKLERSSTPGGGGSGGGGGEEDDDEEEEEEEGNQEFRLAQERRALEETKAVFPRLRERIEGAKAILEGLMASASEEDVGAAKAREALEDAKGAMG